MKRSHFFLFFLILMGTASIYSQVSIFPHWENLSYNTGLLHTVGTPNWTKASGGDDLNVADGNLTYPGYQESSIGRLILTTHTSSEDVKLNFSTIKTSGQKRYVSFLIKVTDVLGLGAGQYFAALGATLTTLQCRLYIRLGGGENTFNLGLGKGGVPAAYSADLNVDQTYFIVMSYQFVDGAGNDILKLWINPDPNVSEPAATFEVTAGTDADSVNGFYLRQGTGTQNSQIDAIKLLDNWDGPMPVNLASFTSKMAGKDVELNWVTTTEISNYGFDVERSENSHNFTKIAFVKGSGNSNSAKKYSYLDKSVKTGTYSYRLKQIDNDGSVKYSPIVTVEVNNLPGGFTLSPNYPNPFNPSTTIKYSLPAESRVTITIFNVIGETVSEISQTLAAGSYDYNFTAGNINSGVYFYRLKAVPIDGTSPFTKTLKMILTK